MLEKIGLILGMAACVPGIIALTVILNGRAGGYYIAAAVILAAAGEALMLLGAKRRKKAEKEPEKDSGDPLTT